MRSFLACVAVMVAACAAPAIDATLETDGIKLPDRAPGSTGEDEGGATLPGDSGPGPQAGTFTLTVTLTGSGKAAVTSAPAGVTCAGTTCTGTFPRGTVVALTAAPATGSVFGAWSGGCTGTSACSATMNGPVAVTAELQSLEGTWSGTYTNNRVFSACNFTNAGNLVATVKASGATVSSSETITGLELRSIPSCALVAKTSGTAPAADITVAGNTLTGTWTFAVQGANGTLAFPFTAKVTGKTMTGSWTCPTCTGSFTLTTP